MQEALCSETGEVGTFQDLDEAFHQTMMLAVGYPGIHKVIRANSGHLNRLRRLDRWEEDKLRRILRQHRDILEAIASRDPVAAEGAMREHLSKTIDRITALRAEYPQYFKA